MSSVARDTHVFIVRLWKEPREVDGAQPQWRGMIEHVPTGERRALGRIDGVCEVIRARLDEPVAIRSPWRRLVEALHRVALRDP